MIELYGCFTCERPKLAKYGMFCDYVNEHCSMVMYQVNHEGRSLQECWKLKRAGPVRLDLPISQRTLDI